uniref:Alternative protein SMYD3 n=1 Tax=Homo sapiens TaxID=9606 RepID=L0R6Q4_HUMAN|nr:alternative protein SMYD3 [Homo sapiens]
MRRQHQSILRERSQREIRRVSLLNALLRSHTLCFVSCVNLSYWKFCSVFV